MRFPIFNLTPYVTRCADASSEPAPGPDKASLASVTCRAPATPDAPCRPQVGIAPMAHFRAPAALRLGCPELRLTTVLTLATLVGARAQSALTTAIILPELLDPAVNDASGTGNGGGADSGISGTAFIILGVAVGIVGLGGLLACMCVGRGSGVPRTAPAASRPTSNPPPPVVPPLTREAPVRGTYRDIEMGQA